MKKFKVTITEEVCETFDVEAETIEEAIEIAQDKYYNGEFVLEPGLLTARLMKAESEDGAECTGWEEF